MKKNIIGKSNSFNLIIFFLWMHILFVVVNLVCPASHFDFSCCIILMTVNSFIVYSKYLISHSLMNSIFPVNRIIVLHIFTLLYTMLHIPSHSYHTIINSIQHVNELSKLYSVDCDSALNFFCFRLSMVIFFFQF